MRRNIVPLHNNSRNKPSSNQRTIINHLNQIGSMFNAPSRAIPSRNIVPEPNVHNETESDDDYLDDYIYDENSDTQQDQIDDGEYLLDAFTKTNSERAATQIQISTLPKSKVTKKVQGVCAICLEQWKLKDQYSILPCAHKFHGDCIKDWLQQKNKCPCCNSIVFQ